MEIKISGAAELEAYLKRKGNLNAIARVVRSHGSKLHRTMQRKADFTKGYAQGTTKKSILLSMEDSDLTAIVYPTTEYSPYLEYGTRFMDAQPFVRPALDEVAPRFQSDIRKEMNRR